MAQKSITVILNPAGSSHNKEVKKVSTAKTILKQVPYLQSTANRRNYLAFPIEESKKIYDLLTDDKEWVLFSFTNAEVETDSSVSEQEEAQFRRKSKKPKGNGVPNLQIFIGQLCTQLEQQLGEAKISLMQATSENLKQVTQKLEEAKIAISQLNQNNVNNATGGSANTMGSIMNWFSQAVNDTEKNMNQDNTHVARDFVSQFVKQLVKEPNSHSEPPADLLLAAIKIFRSMFDNNTLAVLIEELKKMPQFSGVLLETQLQTAETAVKITKMQERLDQIFEILVNDKTLPNNNNNNNGDAAIIAPNLLQVNVDDVDMPDSQ